MQNSSTRNIIYATIANESYSPGEQVTGKVYLDIKSTTNSSTTLILKLVGSEKIEIPNSPNIENIIYQHAIPIHIWRSGISINQYIHPFAFILKDNIPASFKYSKPNNFVASVRYEVKAELISSGTMNTISQPQSINIVQKLPNKLENVVEKLINFSRICGIFSKGSTVIRVSNGLKNSIYKDETGIILEIDNSKGRIEINQIQCQIIRKIILYDRSRKPISCQEDVIKTQSIEGVGIIGPGDSWLKSRSKIFNIPLEDKNSDDYISSCKGQFIESSYYAKITAAHLGCFIVSDQPIDIELPIIISTAPNNNLKPLIEWTSAQESPREDLIVIDAYRYTEGEKLRFTINYD